jgi:predicted AAA+ superfamily ATPase
MIERDLAPVLARVAGQHRVVTLTGPRQSGKTTLVRQLLTDRLYRTLERPDVRAFAVEDPVGFLDSLPDGGVLDEVQRVPELLSWIQSDVDEHRDQPGRWILTGSQHMGLLASVSQSLAGRTAVVHLLPPSLAELRRFKSPPSRLLDVIWSGSYPEIHDRKIPPDSWAANYVATYLERDVRQVLEVRQLSAFRRFLGLVAGRTAQTSNAHSLSNDVGVAHGTITSWLSVLETSFLITLLPAWHGNLRKRLTRRSKLHMIDTGICCWLLGIRSAEELHTHSARGALFESWVASEILKSRYNLDRPPDLSHLRTRGGEEVDLVFRGSSVVRAIEVMSGATLSSDHLRGLRRLRAAWSADPDRTLETVLVYGGTESQRRGDDQVIGWTDLDQLDWEVRAVLLRPFCRARYRASRPDRTARGQGGAMSTRGRGPDSKELVSCGVAFKSTFPWPLFVLVFALGWPDSALALRVTQVELPASNWAMDIERLGILPAGLVLDSKCDIRFKWGKKGKIGTPGVVKALETLLAIDWDAFAEELAWLPHPDLRPPIHGIGPEELLSAWSRVGLAHGKGKVLDGEKAMEVLELDALLGARVDSSIGKEGWAKHKVQFTVCRAGARSPTWSKKAHQALVAQMTFRGVGVDVPLPPPKRCGAEFKRAANRGDLQALNYAFQALAENARCSPQEVLFYRALLRTFQGFHQEALDDLRALRQIGPPARRLEGPTEFLWIKAQELLTAQQIVGDWFGLPAPGLDGLCKRMTGHGTIAVVGPKQWLKARAVVSRCHFPRRLSLW